MKLAHVAQGLTIALLLITAWLAWEAREESAAANAKVERLTKASQVSAAPVDPALTMNAPLIAPVAPPPASVPSAPQPAAQKATASITPPEKPAEPAKPLTMPPLPKPLVMPPPGSAGSPAPSVANAPDAPLPLTPLQRRVKDSPALGKVKEVVMDQGFVTLEAGTKQGLQKGMKFDLRRDSAIVGRITVSNVEDGESVADLDPKSVPAGITIKPGDEVISQILDK